MSNQEPQPNPNTPKTETKKISILAISSLTTATAALLTCWIHTIQDTIFFLTIAALMLGISSAIIIKRKDSKRSGFAIAIAGIIISIFAMIGIIATPPA